MPHRSSSSGIQSRMRSFFSSVVGCFHHEMDENREEPPRLQHSSTSFQAGKMVGEGIGLPRTEPLRRALANSRGEPERRDTMANARLFRLPDDDFIRHLDKAFHKEFVYLAAATATVERGSKQGIGQYGANKNQLPSELLFDGHAHAEVDRTIVGILCMKWILTGEYEAFTQTQNSPAKLKPAEFESLREFFLQTFGDSSNSYMLIVSMILNDLGKNENLKGDIRDAITKGDYPEEEQELVDDFLRLEKTLNHDEVIYYAAKLNFLELIREFDGERRRQLELGIQFGSVLNLGQLAQAENVPGSLEAAAKIMKGHLSAFRFKYLEVVLDVAGAQGHVNSTGSVSWISPVYQGYENSRKCVEQIIAGELSARAAYDQILQHRAGLLRKNGWNKVLSTQDARDRALLRLITMARAANARDAQKIEDALESLPTGRTSPAVRDFLNRPVDNLRQALIHGLNVDGIEDGVAIIPYYAPGLLAEIIRVTKAQDEIAQREAVAAFLRLMARAFVGIKPLQGSQQGHILECDLSFAQDTIRDPDFETNPRLLDGLERPETEIYSKEVEPLMKNCYGIRPLSRRGTPKSATT